MAEHYAYTERNSRGDGTRAICTCGWHCGWDTAANAEKYARRHQERPDVNPIYPPRGTVYESEPETAEETDTDRMYWWARWWYVCSLHELLGWTGGDPGASMDQLAVTLGVAP